MGIACYNCGKEGKAKKNFNSSIIIKDNTAADNGGQCPQEIHKDISY